MRIAFYMPFKPMGHSNPSGDLITGGELFEYLNKKGNSVTTISRLRTRWIYWKPWLWPYILLEIFRILSSLRKDQVDIWVTYHSYYKAPDPIGPVCSRLLGIPYVIFQGIYSTKRRRRVKTLPGFILNRMALLSADIVFTNKKKDEVNLKRIIPRNRLCYVKPGIDPQSFVFDERARREMRSEWKVGDDPVILTAAMFRPGVKTEGLMLVIKSCGQLLNEGMRFWLVIAGDGSERRFLEDLAQRYLKGRVIFLGRIARKKMYRYYSGGDIFVFPGIRESLGIVYLEAQSCGLPVVAFNEWGAWEAVVNRKTGLLSNPSDLQRLKDNIALIIKNREIRAKMGLAAQRHVWKNHNTMKNYAVIETLLSDMAVERG
ncbi:glycosyltransferase family 4 protein [Thermodesulfobacteriota bacterium]